MSGPINGHEPDEKISDENGHEPDEKISDENVQRAKLFVLVEAAAKLAEDDVLRERFYGRLQRTLEFYLEKGDPGEQDLAQHLLDARFGLLLARREIEQERESTASARGLHALAEEHNASLLNRMHEAEEETARWKRKFQAIRRQLRAIERKRKHEERYWDQIIQHLTDKAQRYIITASDLQRELADVREREGDVKTVLRALVKRVMQKR